MKVVVMWPNSFAAHYLSVKLIETQNEVVFYCPTKDDEGVSSDNSRRDCLEGTRLQSHPTMINQPSLSLCRIFRLHKPKIVHFNFNFNCISDILSGIDKELA